jgi:hypothetical protein
MAWYFLAFSEAMVTMETFSSGPIACLAACILNIRIPFTPRKNQRTFISLAL